MVLQNGNHTADTQDPAGPYTPYAWGVGEFRAPRPPGVRGVHGLKLEDSGYRAWLELLSKCSVKEPRPLKWIISSPFVF